MIEWRESAGRFLLSTSGSPYKMGQDFLDIKYQKCYSKNVKSKNDVQGPDPNPDPNSFNLSPDPHPCPELEYNKKAQKSICLR